MRALVAGMLGSLLAVGCAHAGGTDARRAAAQPAPSWTTPEGRLESRMDMARTMLDMGRHQEAMAILTEARREAGGELELDVLQARATLALGMAGEAAALLEPRLDRPPKHAEFYRVLGLIRFDQDRLDEAEEAFRRALEIEPDAFASHNNLGFLLLVRDRPDDAIRYLRRALQLHPDDRRARTNLGFALAALLRDEEALEVFRAAHSEPVALANLGLACERRGTPEDALTWYQRALELEPNQPLANEAVRRLGTPSQGESQP